MSGLTEEQKIFFKSLSEEDKIIRFEKAVRLLMEIGDYHVKLLTRHHESDAPKEIGFGYFYPTVKDSWDNVRFSLFLGEGEFRHFSFYPARLLCENIFRLEYYINQNRSKQNEITLWELARVMRRFYDEFGDHDFRREYERTIKELGEAEKTYPNVEEDKADHDPFPNMWNLVNMSKLPGAKGYYIHYRFLSEGNHGKLLSLHIPSKARYKLSLQYIFHFCRWLLLITDIHINRVTRDAVDMAIKRADEILFSATS
ncbi:MAG: hypothetical protein A3B37_00650 [Candidatus Sungbacteria bacterium RIFCSPLOWO2_01_FULL_59_16]|uniref:Uncharacterized protein n=1 Tax=Candidatus Sungbacteria bacterium RIFCSPLOWO2_01_FULL_59_16 TaxID=1802280 RepID=A0A1G2LBB2_9BACT|nr:MAG: hypothetical protein A3B37_00650 [Candidatus Sungbacteria bacterium RIFCSPLOWO2_01_FULL_59_16]